MTFVNTFTPSAGNLMVGFSGRAGAGKNTCAALLFRHGFVHLAFADALRAEVCAAFRADPRMLTERAQKELDRPAFAIANSGDADYIDAMRRGGHDLQAPRSARWTLQRWGTEYRRAIDEAYWIRQVIHQIERLRAAGHRRIAITDVRFANECSLVEAYGGLVVHVERPGLASIGLGTAEHASEQPLKLGLRAIVHNDGNFDHLHAELLRVLHGFGWRDPEADRIMTTAGNEIDLRAPWRMPGAA